MQQSQPISSGSEILQQTDRIRLFRRGNAVGVPLTLNNNLPVFFLLDGGQLDFTLVTEALLARLGVPHATGMERVRVSTIQMGSQYLHDLDLRIAPAGTVDSQMYGGILGRDVMGRFEWMLDESDLIVTPRQFSILPGHRLI